MFARYLQRGVAAGVVAGIAYAAYMVFVGNPLSEYVHEAESGAGHDHGHAHAHEAGAHAHEAGTVVSETTVAAVSAGSGLLWAILLGGVFAVALYLLEPAVPGPSAAKPYLLAAAGFLTVSGVPWLVLPPAAPGAEHAYGIDARLGIYVGLVALGAITVAAAAAAYERGRSHGVGAGLAAGALPFAVVVALSLAAPTVTTHPGLPTDLVSAYRALAVLSQAALWLLVAAAFDALGRRGTAPTTEPTGPSDDALVG
jgi:hypothetical protein